MTARALASLERRATRADGSPDRGYFARVFAVAYVAFVATYLPINVFSIGRRTHTLWLPGEASLPFIPEFEFVYVLGYLLPAVAVLKLPDARRLARLLLAFLLTLGVAYATYLLFPVYLERPALVVDSPATFFLSLEYGDPSYNHFPSLHIATSLLLYLACRDGLRRSWRVLFTLLLIGIAASTLFIKQHYLADVAYGAALAGAAWRLAGRWSSSAARGR